MKLEKYFAFNILDVKVKKHHLINFAFNITWWSHKHDFFFSLRFKPILSTSSSPYWAFPITITVKYFLYRGLSTISTIQHAVSVPFYTTIMMLYGIFCCYLSFGSKHIFFFTFIDTGSIVCILFMVITTATLAISKETKNICTQNLLCILKFFSLLT